MTSPLNRRTMLAGMASSLAGCVSQNPAHRLVDWREDSGYASMYAAVEGEPFPVAAVDLSRLADPKFLRQEVTCPTTHPVGTVVVDPNRRFAHLVQENGRALRYGVGVGRMDDFNFVGEAVIARKAEWPRWTPTPDMIAREHARYEPYRDGLPGGPTNPLGPRALYLYRDGRDTLYRLHGTVEPWTIGTKVSSGCIRLFNQDIIDLYRRVPVGTKVVVLPVETGTA
ncbi:L,D-transpeptidase [Aurantimonas sp. VKM B-3413]|uniref:L,D-transpeptidase n=1 Tax=Aurantimonas sp. VKM B-3413 TaxID=2779401 RepID=UPI001E6151AA|nr:L,D-transpeptidase [Aurantimonas sp. VKM B-3413]MCB8838518.1 L,D-transpeptidase [Aurantimonas sp. VKM B-3413]